MGYQPVSGRFVIVSDPYKYWNFNLVKLTALATAQLFGGH